MKISVGWSMAAVILALAASPAAGQQPAVPVQNFTNTTQLSVGYVANAPNVFTGIAAYMVRPGGFGPYLDFKISLTSRRDDPAFAAEWTGEQARTEFGDHPFRRDDDWLVINAGVTRTFTPELAVYAGLGLTRRVAFREYFDQTGERGELGFYWVEETGESGTGINGFGGLILRAGNRLHFQFGLEAAPPGFVVGAHYAVMNHSR